MHNLQQQMNPQPAAPLLPYDYFDVIGGTSTGGLIAVMLGILRMDIDTCIRTYVELSKEIFPHENFIGRNKLVKFGKAIVGKPRFDADVLERNIKKLIREHLKKLPEHQGKTDQQLEDMKLDFETMNDQSGPKCKVFVCTFDKSTETTFRLRNYTTSEPSTGCTIWQALRATSAAPLIFDSITFGSPIPAEYADGGLRMNNPIRAVVEEAEWLCKKETPNLEIGCVLSIGTGVPSLYSMGDTAKELVDTLKKIATETETTAVEFKGEVNRFAQNPMFRQAEYFRFNVSRGVGDIPLEEWEAITKMNQATNTYMNNKKERVKACVNSIAFTASLISIESLLQSAHVPMKATLFGRDALLQSITVIMNPSPNCKRGVVLWGLPGFGKTQLSLHYIHEHQFNYDLVLWINATSPQTQLQSLRQIESKLYMPHLPPAHPSSLFTTDLSGLVAETFDSILRSLPITQAKLCLLGIDGVDQGDLDIRRLIPEDSQCRILVTTTKYKIALRLESSYEMVPIEVQAISAEDGAELLLHRQQQASPTAKDKDDARRVAGLLGGAPLAMEQAAAMLLTPLTYQAYIDLYKDHFEKCRDFELDGLDISYEKHRSIFASLDILYTELQTDKDAVRLLHLSAFLGKDRIPAALLTERKHHSSTLHQDYEVLRWLQVFSSDPSLPNLALSQLKKLCLIQVEYDTSGTVEFYALQTLVRHWILAKISQKEREDYAAAVFYLLGEHLTNEGNSWEIGGRSSHFIHILTAIEAVEREIPHPAWQPPEGSFFVSCAPCAHCFGRFCFALGQYRRAKQFLTWAIDYDRIYPESRSLEGNETLVIRERLGIVCSKLNDLPEALEHLAFVTAESSHQMTPDDELSLRSTTELRQLRYRLDTLEYAAARARRACQGQKADAIERPLTPPPPPFMGLGDLDQINDTGQSATGQRGEWAVRYSNHNGAKTPTIASISWSGKNIFGSHSAGKTPSHKDADNPPSDSEDTGVDYYNIPPDYTASSNIDTMPEEIIMAQIPLPTFVDPDDTWQPLPRSVLKYFFTKPPNPQGKSDEDDEQDVLMAVKMQAASLHVQPETIVEAMSVCARFERSRWRTLEALWIYKWVSIYRLANSEDNFDATTNAMASWFFVYTQAEQSQAFQTYASHMSLSSSLLNKYLRAESKSGSTPWLLHEAVALRLAPMVQRLLANGADANAQDARGWTPFELALGRNGKVATEEMRHLVIKHLMDYGAKPLLQIAIDADDYMVVDFLMYNYRKEQDDMGRTQLHRAVKDQNIAVLDWLAMFNADASITDKNGWSALHFAAKLGHYNIVELLLRDFSASPLVQDQNGVTPLHISILNEHIDVVSLLLTYGADPHQQDGFGQSPIDLLKSLGYSSDLVADILLSRGAILPTDDSTAAIPTEEELWKRFNALSAEPEPINLTEPSKHWFKPRLKRFKRAK